MSTEDQEFQKEQDHLTELIALASQPSSSRTKPVGYCLSCYEDVSGSMLYCNNLCAKEHALTSRFQSSG